LQYQTESAQARAGIGGQRLAGGMEQLDRKKQNDMLSMLAGMFPQLFA